MGLHGQGSLNEMPGPKAEETIWRMYVLTYQIQFTCYLCNKPIKIEEEKYQEGDGWICKKCWEDK